jgi:hypothetical protein
MNSYLWEWRGKKVERGKEEREMLSSTTEREREPARSEKPKRAKAPTWANPSGSKEGAKLALGIKSSEYRSKAEKVFEESTRTKEEKGNFLFDPTVEKNSEGRNPRALEAEKGFLGFRCWCPREGSQTLRRRLLKDRPTSFRRRKRWRKRVLGSDECWRVRKLTRGAKERGFGRTRTRVLCGTCGWETLKVDEKRRNGSSRFLNEVAVAGIRKPEGRWRQQGERGEGKA